MNDWAELDKERCPCGGCGWAEVSPDLWKECPIHFNGQVHPETHALLLDEPNRLAEEERRALLRFQIGVARNFIKELQAKLQSEQANLVKLELELINKTPTVRMLKATLPKPSEPEPMELSDEDVIFLDGDFI